MRAQVALVLSIKPLTIVLTYPEKNEGRRSSGSAMDNPTQEGMPSSSYASSTTKTRGDNPCVVLTGVRARATGREPFGPFLSRSQFSPLGTKGLQSAPTVVRPYNSNIGSHPKYSDNRLANSLPCVTNPTGSHPKYFDYQPMVSIPCVTNPTRFASQYSDNRLTISLPCVTNPIGSHPKYSDYRLEVSLPSLTNPTGSHSKYSDNRSTVSLPYVTNPTSSHPKYSDYRSAISLPCVTNPTGSYPKYTNNQPAFSLPCVTNPTAHVLSTPTIDR
ncbi:hypothetical protein AMTR_s00113p00038590 [Amborella trichopoda]|uniref:Uncharacterized protein n=1 Tax=Amborella trichopoda TaxID=13333 RepID=W1NPD9_AMBTC|nr:hypothetical protein AMTR_s00113p00038590 [Amborella trichopoda]